MRLAFVCLALALGGCMPMIQYQSVEDALSREIARRKTAEQQLDSCEGQNRKLREELKRRPAPTIKPTELEEIKQKALREAEEKYKSGVKGKARQ